MRPRCVSVISASFSDILINVVIVTRLLNTSLLSDLYVAVVVWDYGWGLPAFSVRPTIPTQVVLSWALRPLVCKRLLCSYSRVFY